LRGGGTIRLSRFRGDQAEHWDRSRTGTLWDSSEARACTLSARPLSAAYSLFATEPGEFWRPRRPQRVGLSLGLLVSSAPRQSCRHDSGFGGVDGRLHDSGGGTAITKAVELGSR